MPVAQLNQERAISSNQQQRVMARRGQYAVASFWQPVPRWLVLIAVSGALWGLTTEMPLLTATSWLILPILASLLLFKGESPILFVCCCFQWLQVVVAIFYAGAYNITLDKLLEYPELESAAWLSLLGLVALAFGMRTALDSVVRGVAVAERVEASVGGLSLGRLYRAWWFTFFISSVALGAAWKFRALQQAFIPIFILKWVLFYMAAYVVLARNEKWGPLLIILCCEFLSGFGFFSSYKEALIMLVIVIMSLRRSLSIQIKALAGVVLTLGFVASLFWSVIKVEYRDYLQRQNRQKDGATMEERLTVLRTLVSTMNEQKMDEGFKALVSRVSYIGFFGSTLNHVPAFEPNANGELWLGAVKHVLMPRVLFPNKAALDDSARARRYTGLRLAGAEEGTSIGIGYMAESYADLGRYGMFIPIYLLGLLMGRIYRNFCLNKHSALLGSAIATAVIFPALHAYETSNVKILGSLVLLSLAYSIMNRVLGKHFINWLQR